MLKSNAIWPNNRRYKSHSEWEPIGFFSEALCNSTSFDLMLGFFSSSAINVLSDSFATFLFYGGKMRMVINDILSQEDRDAIIVGEEDFDIPFFNIKEIESLSYTLSKRDRHFFECLAWLIRNGRIEIKIITPKEGTGIAHSKCGVFSDGCNKVAFDGSCNFSQTALIENIENISAFCDWDSETDKARVFDVESDFTKTFSGEDDSVIYLNAEQITDSISQQYGNKEMKDLLEDEYKLINERYSSHYSPTIRNILKKAQNTLNTIILKKQEEKLHRMSEPSFPYPSGPRDYQIQALENWKNNKKKGLFAMATGTGKTLTALNCLLQIYNSSKYYKALILVPTITLVDQWEEECKKFNFNNIIKVCSKYPQWKEDIDHIQLMEIMDSASTSYIIISTYASYASDNVFPTLNSFPPNKLLLIADEAHNMGSGRIMAKLEGIRYSRRIGLSATPQRQFDDEINGQLYKFFGSSEKFTFEYSMKEAIDNGFLCRYYYYPHIVQLTDAEMVEYMKISKQLADKYNSKNNDSPQDSEICKMLLLKRKRIIHKASNKVEVFKQIIEEQYKERGNLKYTLVYVPEGNKADDNTSDIYDTMDVINDEDETNRLIDTYTRIIRATSPTTTVKKFTSESHDRDDILFDFANGDLEVLTSMKCLDEGVDVPRSELAIFCASTGNPRQFIQRRGRILRTHKNKKRAYIHDLVVVPNISSSSASFEVERNLLNSELKRIRDFALMSENDYYTINQLEEILEHYNLSIF